MSYFDHIADQRVLIIGLVPPPLGGISVHIKRAVERLRNQNNQVAVVEVCKEYAQRSQLGYVYFLVKTFFKQRPQIIYYHTLMLRRNLVELYVLIALKKIIGARLVLVEHSDRFLYQRSKRYVRRLNRCIGWGLDEQVLIGQPMLQAYRAMGVRVLPNACVATSYVSPDLAQEPAIWAQYPADLHTFLGAHRVILLVNASSFVRWQGVDVYGIDLCEKLMADLPGDCALICAVGGITDEGYHRQVLKRLTLLGDRVYILLGCQQEMWPLTKRVALFLRPSRFDTLGMSVCEALELGCITIASDVCPRPDGCITFKTGNYADLLEKVRRFYEQYTSQRGSAHVQQN